MLHDLQFTWYVLSIDYHQIDRGHDSSCTTTTTSTTTTTTTTSTTTTTRLTEVIIHLVLLQQLYTMAVATEKKVIIHMIEASVKLPH